MRVEVHDHTVVVFREPGAPRAKGESHFWYQLKKVLNANDYDLVKRIMARDGHMVGSDWYPHYLRDRKWQYCIYDPDYAIRRVDLAYNAGDVMLVVERWADHNAALPHQSGQEVLCLS